MAQFRKLVVPTLALGIALPTFGALCDQLHTVEEEVASLRSSITSLRAEARAKEQRLANVRSWMPDAEARQRLAVAKAAHEKAKSEEAKRHADYQRVRRQREDAHTQLTKLQSEMRNLQASRASAEKLNNVQEVRELQRQIDEHEAFLRSQIGMAPASAPQARALAVQVADMDHIGWLQAEDLSVFGLDEFVKYQPPSNRGADGSRLWTLEQDLARQVNAYGDQATGVSRRPQVRDAIRRLADQVRSTRSETAARLNQLAGDREGLQSATKRTATNASTAGRAGAQTGFLSEEQRAKRIAELETRIEELRAIEQRLEMEQEANVRTLSDVGPLGRAVREAETALTRANQGIREADRRDLAEAEREASDARARLQQAEERLPLALQEISHLRRLLNEKAADINRVISEARGIPDQMHTNHNAGRIEQCNSLRLQHQAELQEALGKYNEEAACLAASLPAIPREIAQIMASVRSVSCGTSEPASPPVDDPLPPTEPDGPPPVQTGCGGPAPPGQTYVPAIANVGLRYQQAMAVVQAASLRPFAFEHKVAETQADDGKVTGQNPAPCTLATLGARVDVFFNADSGDPEPPPGSQSGRERTGGLETVAGAQSTPSEGDSRAPFLQSPVNSGGEPAADEVDILIRDSEAAAARCDFPMALEIGRRIGALSPNHGWVISRYPGIQTEQQNYHIAKNTVEQARALLQKANPTRDDAGQASDLARRVQNIAPLCMSREVSLLNGPIQQVADALQQNNRESMEAGIARLLGALGAVSTALAPTSTIP